MNIFVLIAILIIIIYFYNSQKVEGFLNYSKCSQVDVPHVIKDIFKDREFKQDNKNYDVYFPCGYNYIEHELNSMSKPQMGQKVFGITGCDSIVAKDTLWSLLYKFYGNNADKIAPRTYLTTKKEDLQRFLNEYVPKKKYILKKNVQRQEGIFISDNKDDIIKKVNNDRSYVVIQELLTNPFILNGRKINMRVYLLVICNKGNTKVYYHKNGFMYYTKDTLVKNKIDYDNIVTTGYIDRKVYDENPLTLEDFRKWLNKNGYSSKKLDNNLMGIFKKIVSAIKGSICNGENVKDTTTFQIFGTDIAPDPELNMKIMEFNKGPDMSFKDERDGEVKKKLNKDIFNLLGMYNYDEKNEFIRVY